MDQARRNFLSHDMNHTWHLSSKLRHFKEWKDLAELVYVQK